jgi:hypothetical protein
LVIIEFFDEELLPQISIVLEGEYDNQCSGAPKLPFPKL